MSVYSASRRLRARRPTDQSNVWQHSFRSKSERWRAVWSAVVPTHSPRPHALKCPRSKRSTAMTSHAVMQQLRACAQIVRLFSTTSSAPVSPAHSHTLQNEAVDKVVRLLESAQTKRFLALALSFRRAVRNENPKLDAGGPKAATKEVVDAKPEAAAKELVDGKPKAALLMKKRPAAHPRCGGKDVRMFHKRSRRKSDATGETKGQVFQLKEVSRPEERLYGLASKALQQLASGRSEADMRAFVFQALAGS